jgi:hypothetical protein
VGLGRLFQSKRFLLIPAKIGFGYDSTNLLKCFCIGLALKKLIYGPLDENLHLRNCFHPMRFQLLHGDWQGEVSHFCVLVKFGNVIIEGLACSNNR